MKIFFLHPHKTGGTSVIRKLNLNRTHRTYKSLSFFNKNIFSSQNSFADLYTNLRLLNQAKPKYLISNNDHNKDYYIGIVRNPYRRVCSWYNNVKNDINHQTKFNFKKNMSLIEFIKANENTLPLKPMTYWFTDWNGKYIINNFIRNENLENDLNKILSKIGVSKVKLEYLNKSKSIYNFKDLIDEQAIKWIFDNHYEDFINFGYNKNVY